MSASMSTRSQATLKEIEN